MTFSDNDLEVTLVEKVPAAGGDTAPYYRFEMRRARTGEYMGRISLRVSNAAFFRFYAGHIGYQVEPPFRGNHYAARAVRLLIPVARHLGFTELWITCNPDNVASRRTCELAGAEYVETVALPEWTDMYERGDRQKCRYRLPIPLEEA
ncbi:MAG: GNAT family N-acetyltransferase [Bryobacteraceae bacterium]|nr:GNAT family N-acetyltransferase [Bryobacteraceae bacterium]